jgi:hypothetical protein
VAALVLLDMLACNVALFFTVSDLGKVAACLIVFEPYPVRSFEGPVCEFVGSLALEDEGRPRILLVRLANVVLAPHHVKACCNVPILHSK